MLNKKSKETLINSIKKETKDSISFFQEQLSHELESHQSQEKAKKSFLNNSKKCLKQDYINWLNGFLNNGGIISHFHDYNICMDKWIILKKDSSIYPLYGANSLNILVPNGIRLDISNGTGHNELFFMENFKNIGVVPYYSDLDLIDLDSQDDELSSLRREFLQISRTRL